MIKQEVVAIKRLFFLWGITLLVSCNSESALDCFQTSGAIVTQELDFGEFSRIVVNRDIRLEIVQGTVHKVTIETGENLINDVRAEVQGNRLVLNDDNTCNFVRDYGITKIRVEAPDLTEIRSSTQYEINSIGVLNFQDLTLISEDETEPSEFTVGDFRLSINSENVTVVSNNIAFFYLDGTTTDLDIGFFSGSGRFEGANLIAQDVNVFHRGSNDMIVNPQQSLTGELVGPGDLISVNTPPVIAVEELYTGRLIFN